jgi:ABC-type transport system involved in multi-copper enzyme maturation permease subunit
MASTLRIVDLSLGQMLWSRRSVFLGLLVGGPVVLALAIRVLTTPELTSGIRVTGVQVDGASLFGVMIWLLYIRFVVPVLGIFYGTALIADEVDDKTITYLFTRPIPRDAVLMGKYLAYLICTTLLVLPSVVLVYFFVIPVNGGHIGEAFPSLVVDLGVIAVGLAAYGSVFALIGARLRRPLVVGLVFAFGWEPAVLLFPGYLKRLTVGYYLQGLVPHTMPQDSTLSAWMQMFTDTPTLAASLGSLVLLTLGSLWLAGRVVDRREYVLEQ